MQLTRMTQRPLTTAIMLLLMFMLTACMDTVAPTPISTPIIIVVTATSAPITNTPIPRYTPTSVPTAIPTSIPEPTATSEPPATPTPAVDAVVNDTNVNLRTGPGFEYPSLGKYSTGAVLTLLGKSRDGVWLQVNTDLSSIAVATALPPPSPTADPGPCIPITIKLLNKGFQRSDFSAGIYDDYITFDVSLTNNEKKDIRAFTGSIMFVDLFDKKIKSYNLTIEDRIKAGKTVNSSRQASYNQFIDDDVRLRTIATEDVRLIYEVSEVVFTDDTRKQYFGRECP